jgi:nitrile hydratase
MNGVHDMGGMHGFGRVVVERDEPVFHAGWERRVFALASAALGAGVANVDEFRHAIERIPPARYLASSYYQRWLDAVESLLIEKGVLTRDEAAAASGRSVDEVPVASPPRTDTLRPAEGKNPTVRARFRIGERVRARNLNPSGHTRLPRYLRGRCGTIARDWGVFVFPDTNAHLLGTKPQHVYSVEFAARELWGRSAPPRDKLLVDLWEDYLEPDRREARNQHPRRSNRSRRR